MEQNEHQTTRALPTGTILSHKYIINNVIGEGGFGITYSCTLKNAPSSETIYAVKEYYPDNAAHRSSDKNGYFIQPYIGKQDIFEKGKKHFLREAGILSKFSYLPHIVSIDDIFEENGTIYIVMDYIDGITMKQYVEDNEPLTIDELSTLITPVMRDISEIHKSGLLHRDISPDNLILGTDNMLHLIDFGSASYENVGENELKTVILKSGFAPPEQYTATGKAGAWTDVYGICATMYYSLTGFIPNESILRLQKDDLPSLSDHFGTSSWKTDVIMKGLNLHPADRYQTMDELYQAFVIPPVDINSEMRQKLTAVKYSKTVMPTMNSLHSKITLLRFGIAVLLIYAVLGFCGVSLPLWSESWTYASLSKSLENENETTTDNSSDLTKTDSYGSNIDSVKPEGKSTTVKNAGSKASDTNTTNNTTAEKNTSTQSNTSDEKNASAKNNNTTTEKSTSTQNKNTTAKNNSSTTTKNAGDTTSGKKNSQKTTEQEEDIFISMPDDEYDTFTD